MKWSFICEGLTGVLRDNTKGEGGVQKEAMLRPANPHPGATAQQPAKAEAVLRPAYPHPCATAQQPAKITVVGSIKKAHATSSVGKAKHNRLIA